MDERGAALDRSLPTRNFPVQILRWQEPPEATVAKTYLPVSVLQPISKIFSLFPKSPLTAANESTCNLHSCKTGNLIERHGGKP
jgi:hypothetical protein